MGCVFFFKGPLRLVEVNGCCWDFFSPTDSVVPKNGAAVPNKAVL